MELTHDTAQMVASLRQHIKADALITDTTQYKNGKGCFITCAERTYDAALVEKRRGIPQPVLRIGEAIFEGFTKDEQGFALAKKFTADYADRIFDGMDLSKLHWHYLVDLLGGLPQTNCEDVTAVVAASLDIVKRRSRGEDVPAAEAARAARAADAAAWAAEAARAADAAEAAADAAALAARAARAARAAAGAAGAAGAARAARAAAGAARATRAAHGTEVNEFWSGQAARFLALLDKAKP